MGGGYPGPSVAMPNAPSASQPTYPQVHSLFSSLYSSVHHSA